MHDTVIIPTAVAAVYRDSANHENLAAVDQAGYAQPVVGPHGCRDKRTTAVGETIEVIEQDVVQPESRPLQVRRASFAWQSDCGQNSILARKPKRSDVSTPSRNGAITWRSGVTWHQGVTATL